MAIIKAAARLIVREHAAYRFRDPVLCLGVPDIYLERAELDRALGREGTSAAPPGREPAARLVSAAEFFQALGMAEVTSLDIEGAAHDPDLRHDLNAPLPDPLRDRFELVVDPGTTEHVFDLRSALTNVVYALRVGGAVIHFVPIYSYNGGYISINPSLFHDFYGANGFVDIRSYIILWDRYRQFGGPSRVYRYTKELEPRHALADRDLTRYVPHLLFFARKAEARPNIVVPVQHEDHQVRPPRLLGRIARRVLPEDVVLYLVTMARRERQLFRSHRRSFWI